MVRSRSFFARRGGVVVALVAGVLATSLSACAVGPARQLPTKVKVGRTGQPAPARVKTSPNPVADTTGGVRNVTFYYRGNTPLIPGNDLTNVGTPSIVVATPKADDAKSIAAIHSVGALAYRYVQFYWAPNNAAYEGLNLAEHPEWAFCRSGNTPLVGRTTKQNGKNVDWYFIDANETAVRAAFAQVLAGFRSEGWDGVMFDRGGAAMQQASDSNGKPVWDVASSCTQSPYEKGATFADSYVNMLGVAHQVGLQVMVNAGASPFDPVTPMRPDPSNAACQARDWTKCTFLSDVWNNVDLALNESAAHPKDVAWARDFVANRRSEQDRTVGKRVVALITTFSLGGASHQNKADVYYEWSRIKLFDLAVAVNTGDGGCTDPQSGVCNRFGLYPELVNIEFGAPNSKQPTSFGCESGSVIHCVWKRTYAHGVNVLNASDQDRNGVSVSLGTSTCRYVYDVHAQQPLAGDSCVMSVDLDLPAWSGRPLLTSDKAWT